MVSSRRQARITALQTLYEVDSTGHLVDEVLRRNLDEPTSENPNPTPLDDPTGRAFARSLVSGVLGNTDELDLLIEKSAPNWPIDQMSRIDKTILRLAIFEILFDNRVPMKAAINEAVELGKRFGSDSSSRFINGVLGSVASENQRRVRTGTTGAGAAEEYDPDDPDIEELDDNEETGKRSKDGTAEVSAVDMANQRNEVYKRLRTILADALGADEDEVTWETNVYDDLNADTLEFHDEVIPTIEEEFSVVISNDDVPDLTTVRDLVDYVVENI